MSPAEIPGRNGDRRDAHHRQARRTAGKGDSIYFSTTAKSFYHISDCSQSLVFLLCICRDCFKSGFILLLHTHT